MPTLYSPYLTAAKTAPALQWDSRLDARGAELATYTPMPGATWYKLVHAEWLDEQQAQGRHHILVDVLDEQGRRLTGVPVRCTNGGEVVRVTEAKPGESAATNFPMFASGWGYRVEVAYASDRVSRLGLGTIADPHAGVHTGYYFVWQRTTAGVTIPDPPQPPPVDPPLPPTLDPILDALARARNAIDRAMTLYSQREAG